MKKLLLCFTILMVSCLNLISQSIQPLQPDIRWGGRTVSITVHPVTTNEVIAASASGGLFKSTDGGTSWRHLDNLPVFDMMDVKYNPIFHNKVIATCLADTDTSHKMGIWLSNDRGETWSQIDGLVPSPSARDRSRFPKRYSAYGISFDRNGVAYVGTDYGVAVGMSSHSRWEHVIHDNTIPVSPGKLQNAVYSVHSFGSGKLVIGAKSGVYYCNDMYLGVPFRKSTTGVGFSDQNVHGIAQSPYYEKDIFITPNLDTLLYSGDTARNFTGHSMPWPAGRVSRTPLVVITRSSERDMVDVYVHKVALARKRYHKDRLTDFSADWQRMNVAHDDISSGAVVDNSLLYVTGDGGVFKKSSDTWNCVGMGRGGYNALQINQAWGQRIVRPGSGEPVKTDYYIGTQDNVMWSSSDGGITWPYEGGIEGGGFDGPRVISDPSLKSVVSVNNSSGWNQFSRSNFTDLVEWQDPGQPRGNPKYVGSSSYLQTFTDTLSGDIRIMNTFSNGRTWFEISRISGYRLWQGEKTDTDPEFTMYLPYARQLPFTNEFSNVGLLRLQKKNVPPFKVVYSLTNMDNVRSMGSLMVYANDFAWPAVYGFDNNDSRKLLAPDVENKVMKWSFDGGQTWKADYVLTGLITENDRYVFFEPGNFSVYTVSFNPSDSRQIAIGTKQSGIIYSSDGGMSWCRIPGSKQIPKITSIWWDFDGTALVSSYGRGLWRFNPALYRPGKSECVSNLIIINPKNLVKPISDFPLDGNYTLPTAETRVLPAMMKPDYVPMLDPDVTMPVASIITSTTRAGEMVVGASGSITIAGYGFSASSSTSLELNGQILVKSIPVNKDGTIKYPMIFKRSPGIYKLEIIQFVNKKRIATPVHVKVPFTDKAPGN